MQLFQMDDYQSRGAFLSLLCTIVSVEDSFTKLFDVSVTVENAWLLLIGVAE